ncbi:MAG: hypothetical protein BalsKO_27710 [Balneolaceae bacterium]
MTIVALSLFFALGIVMGMFSITQLGYQQRIGGLKMFGKGIISFLRGFFFWPVLFPLGLKNLKYKMNVQHKVGRASLDL